MNKIKRAYDYLFFTIYRFWETALSKWWSEGKTIITLIILKILILLNIYGLVIYNYKVLENPISKSRYFPYILALIIYLFDHYYFLHKKKWKKKVHSFKGINKKKDKMGIIIVCTAILLIFSSFIYSIYLVSTVDWGYLWKQKYPAYY